MYKYLDTSCKSSCMMFVSVSINSDCDTNLPKQYVRKKQNYQNKDHIHYSSDIFVP